MTGAVKLRPACCMAVLGALISVSGLWRAEPARAGIYTSELCKPSVGAYEPETVQFETNDPVTSTFDTGWAPAAVQDPCWANGANLALAMSTAYGAAPPGSYGQWQIPTPPGLRFLGGALQAQSDLELPGANFRFRLLATSGAAVGGDLITGSGWYVFGAWHTNAGAPPANADELVVQGECPSGCAAGSGQAWLAVAPLGVRIEDYQPPALGPPSGALMEGAAQRGTQVLDLDATDVGAGVAEISVRVNGQPYTTLSTRCRTVVDPGMTGDNNLIGVALSPCPGDTGMRSVAIDTTTGPFVEGKNAMEVCARDFASAAGSDTSVTPNESCTPVGVYVDNSCAISQAPDAADVRFGFGKRSSGQMTLRYGKRARVVAKLTDAAERAIEGGTVCVSARDRTAGAPEVDLAQLETNKHGRASAKLPKGASRRVRLTYWADAEHVEMRAARLKVRARPRLRVFSKHKLSDGGTARFEIKLAGPYRRHRKVTLQALAPAGWLEVPGCSGRSNEKGVFRCSYRFRRQSGDVKYKFRALAPRQRDYPYLQGRSRPKAVVVHDR
jgi:hypothetical protein